MFMISPSPTLVRVVKSGIFWINPSRALHICRSMTSLHVLIHDKSTASTCMIMIGVSSLVLYLPSPRPPLSLIFPFSVCVTVSCLALSLLLLCSFLVVVLSFFSFTHFFLNLFLFSYIRHYFASLFHSLFIRIHGLAFCVVFTFLLLGYCRTFSIFFFFFLFLSLSVYSNRPCESLGWYLFFSTFFTF
ncbi:hypothetical protein CPC08DRAFT_118639 [Agrocybe pediades]|nr:hypothetical protein CPC08DRAFT_118639 [Agrocybe pediades]